MLAVDMYGDYLLVGCTDGKCFYWQLSTERVKVRLLCPSARWRFRGLTLLSSGQRTLTGHSNKTPTVQFLSRGQRAVRATVVLRHSQP